MTCKTVFATLAFLAGTTSALAQDAVFRTILGIDVSGSSTFLYEQASADAAARYVHDYIADLDTPHDLLMISVGDPGLAQRAIDIRATVTERRATSPEHMAGQFGGYFGAMPSLVQSGQLTADDTTSLVAFFQSVEPICSSGSTRVILFSDGVEWSAEVDGRAFLDGAASLPAPTHEFLSGCYVELHGVGQLKADLDSSGLEARLIPIWRDWMTAAGADSVRVTGSFFTF